MHKSYMSFQNQITYQVVISFWYIIQKLLHKKNTDGPEL